MFLPIKTEGYDGKPRSGALAIILACVLMQLWAWHDKSKRAAAVTVLKYGGTPECATGRMTLTAMETAEDFGILKTSGMRIERSEIALNRLEQMRKASVVYRSGLVADQPNPLNFITALFTHAGWIHLLFTLWFLYLAGSTMEKYWGTGPFLGVFFACGIIGEFAYLIGFGHSDRYAGFALVGPTGSLAAMMVAFAVTHWNSRAILVDIGFGPLRGYRDFSVRRIVLVWAAMEILTCLLLPGRGGGLSLSAALAGGWAGLVLGKCLPGEAARPMKSALA
jgi:membrane associated rhomboid family serine protease